jgi:putative endonuclease
MNMSCYLYILRSEVKETYYTGSSEDPDRRLTFHNDKGDGYTRRYRPWQIVYRHKFKTRREAERAELLVKGWKSKRMIQLLVSGVISIDDYL